MLRYNIRFLLLFELLFIYILTDNGNELQVSHTVLIEANYYGTKDKISDAFADFTEFTIYIINETIIYRKLNETPHFNLQWDSSNKITLDCVKPIKCTQIKLQNHEFYTFNFDKFIAKLGGVFSYLLLLYGFFSLRRGIVYFNLTVIFYCTFGFILFFRELCQLIELTGKLNTEDPQSKRILYAVFTFAILSSLLYGASCHFSKYLKYITFGFINGLFISKIINYYLIKLLKAKILLVYFIIELIFCLGFMILFIFLQNKNYKICIIYIVSIAGYGIIYGINILFGGLPFFPFLILSKLNMKGDNSLFDKLMDKDFFYIYGIFFLVLIAFGYYENYINYRIATHKTMKKIINK